MDALEIEGLKEKIKKLQQENKDLLKKLRKNKNDENLEMTQNADDITLEELLNRLRSINIEDQIDRINHGYKNELGWNYSLNVRDIIRNKQKGKKLILTAIVCDNDIYRNNTCLTGKYGLNSMQYAYQTKLVYSHLYRNQTIFILDTFDYISHLNLSDTFTITTPTNITYNEWNNILSPYFHESVSMKHAQNINQSWDRDKFTRFDCTNLLNSFWARKKKYMHNYYYFQYSYRITSHFNKILSIMYWSDYLIIFYGWTMMHCLEITISHSCIISI